MFFYFRLPLEWGRYGDEMSVAPLSRQGHSIIAHRFNGGVVSEGIENESLWDGRRFRLERWTRIRSATLLLGYLKRHRLIGILVYRQRSNPCDVESFVPAGTFQYSLGL